MSQRGHKWQISDTMCPDSWDPDLLSTVITFLVSSPQVPNQRRLCPPAHECSGWKIIREDFAQSTGSLGGTTSRNGPEHTP